MSIAEKFEVIADEVYAKAREDELTEFNGTAMPFPNRKTNPTIIAEKFEVITDELYAKGRDDQWNENWDELQENGNRTNYSWLFSGSRWNDVSFKPKYDIVPTNAGELFLNSGVVDLMGILERQNVKLDFSKATRIAYLNQFGNIKRFGVIDTRSCNSLGTSLLGENYSVVTIDKFIFKEDGSQSAGGKIDFWGAFWLKNIVIEGTMGANVNFQHSNGLTYESLMSIINALKDYSGTAETRTLTLHNTAKARLSESDIATATQKGWTIS